MGIRYKFRDFFEKRPDGWYSPTRTVTYDGNVYPPGSIISETRLCGLFGKQGYKDVEVTREAGTDIYHIIRPWPSDDNATETNNLWDHLAEEITLPRNLVTVLLDHFMQHGRNHGMKTHEVREQLVGEIENSKTPDETTKELIRMIDNL